MRQLLEADSITPTLKGSAMNEEVLLVCGSFFIMRDVRAALNLPSPRDPVDLNEVFGSPKPTTSSSV